MLPGLFPTHATKVSRSSADVQERLSAWEPIMQKWHDVMEWAVNEGPKKHVERHHARGMLSVRDRISMILDEESPFLELMPVAGFNVKESSPCANMVVGIGLVHSRIVMIMGNIPTSNSGAVNEITVKKQRRASEIALENNLPTIFLNQSAGANLPQQFRVFHEGGAQFRGIARRSAAGAPTCTVVFGSSTAGGAYQPGMSNYSIFVKDQAQIFLGGPPLVKMATGEETDAEELGGAQMHTSVSGVGDVIASDEFEACRMARSWVLSLRRQRRNHIRQIPESFEPRYSCESILEIVPVNVRQPLDMAEVLIRLVDDSRYEEFKPGYGTGLLCCWANIHGRLTGILANQTPVILIPEAQKAVQFIRLNNENSTPIVFLHNVTGFMVGKKSEQGGIIKAGSLFIDAVSRSNVPHISIICGASYGAGNYAMCGRAYAPRFLFSWPQSKCSVMGPEQLAGVMDIIAREASAKSKKVIDEAKLAARTGKLKEQVEGESEAWSTSAWILDDGVIDPRDTRNVLGMCLEICEELEVEGNPGMRGVSRI